MASRPVLRTSTVRADHPRAPTLRVTRAVRRALKSAGKRLPCLRCPRLPRPPCLEPCAHCARERESADSRPAYPDRIECFAGTCTPPPRCLVDPAAALQGALSLGGGPGVSARGVLGSLTDGQLVGGARRREGAVDESSCAVSLHPPTAKRQQHGAQRARP